MNYTILATVEGLWLSGLQCYHLSSYSTINILVLLCTNSNVTVQLIMFSNGLRKGYFVTFAISISWMIFDQIQNSESTCLYTFCRYVWKSVLFSLRSGQMVQVGRFSLSIFSLLHIQYCILKLIDFFIFLDTSKIFSYDWFDFMWWYI